MFLTVHVLTQLIFHHIYRITRYYPVSLYKIPDFFYSRNFKCPDIDIKYSRNLALESYSESPNGLECYDILKSPPWKCPVSLPDILLCP